MIYAELYGQDGEPYIKDRGIFLSIQEFLPYRSRGWSSTREINRMADNQLTLLERLNNKWQDSHGSFNGITDGRGVVEFARQAISSEIDRILHPLDTDSARIAKLVALQEEAS